MNNTLDRWGRNFQKVIDKDQQAKKQGKLVGRFVREPHADNYAYYRIIRENKATVRIKVITDIGDDYRIPYWGEETTIDKEYALKNIGMRDYLAELVEENKKLKKESKKLSEEKNTLTVSLASVGNIDYGQNPFQPLFGVPTLKKEVSNLEEAAKVCREYIDEYNLGGSHWSGGEVFDSNGKQVAYVSYNGRVWSPDREKELI